MAGLSVKHETLKGVTADIAADLARDVRTLTAMGLSAYEQGVPTFGDDDSAETRIQRRMEAIEYCLRHIGEVADILVHATAAVARPVRRN